MLHSILLTGLLSALTFGSHVQGVLVSEHATAQSGGTLSLGLHLELEPGWHVYWINPGDAGIPPSIAWSETKGATPDSLQWPVPDTLPVSPLMTYGFKDRVLLPFSAKVSPDAQGNVVFKGHAKWLECSDICVPGKAELSLTLPVSAAVPTANAETKPLFEQARRALPARGMGGSVRAAVSDSFVYLTVKSTQGTDQPVRFLPLDQGVIENASVQPWIATKDGFCLKIRRDGLVRLKPDSLRGILVHPKGWNSGRKGWLFTTPLVPATAADTVEIRPPPAKAGTGNETTKGLLMALFFAFLGGIALNLMPCVLPVLSLKVLDFLKKGGQSRHNGFLHALVFAAGTILSFLALAGVLLVLRSGGEALGWGFQMQSPRVVGILSMLMALLALNLWGVFEPGAAFASRIGTGPGGGWVGSFFTGVTATVVATPCTAPFMGAALGYTLTRPAFETLSVFFFLGLGMSLPYMALAGFPRLAAFLPRPGAWMESLKQFFGFAMAATAVWLAWVVGRLAGADAAVLVAGLWVFAGLGAWILGRWALPHHSTTKRWSARLTFTVIIGCAVAVLCVALPQNGQSRTESTGRLAGEPFREGTLAELRSSGKPWFLYFTADWCLSCQVNERVALERPEVVAAFQRHGIRVVKADWTGRDSLIARTLQTFGRQGVPFYVWSDGTRESNLPELLTPGIVLGAIEPRQ